MNHGVEEWEVAGMAKRELQEALAAIKQAEGMTAKLAAGVEAMDLQILRPSIAQALSAGFPESYSTQALAARSKIQLFLTKVASSNKAHRPRNSILPRK